MTNKYLTARGRPVDPSLFHNRWAREAVTLLQSGGMPFIRLLECRQVDKPAAEEIVVFEVDVEVPQRPVHDIHRVEHLAVVFSGDDKMPETLALRTNFPLVPHLMLGGDEYPRYLCLYEQPFRELRLSWTVAGHFQRVRHWLAATADGTLHAPDQPLEPLLMGGLGTLIIPPSLLNAEKDHLPKLLAVTIPNPGDSHWVLVAQEDDGADRQTRYSGQPPDIRFTAFVLRGTPQTHGVIPKQPTNLAELDAFLRPAGIHLLDRLRAQFRIWHGHEPLLDTKLALILALPKARYTGAEAEAVEVRAFGSPMTLGEIGEKIGVLKNYRHVNGGRRYAKPFIGTEEHPDQARVHLFNVNFAFTGDQASVLNGQLTQDHSPVVALGLGALGSHVFINAVRSGFGQWTLIDDDVLLPHNLSRHALDGSAVATSKATALAAVANRTISGPAVARAIVADVLSPGFAKQEIEDALDGAAIIVDMTASVPVARYLAHEAKSGGRRVSLFLNPSGSDLVMLAEDNDRKIPLNWLEMIYYRELVRQRPLESHLSRAGDRVRYGQSCRDLSSTIPQEKVALHASIGSRAVRAVQSETSAVIAMWRSDDEMNVAKVGLRPNPPVVEKYGDWSLFTDQALLDKIHRLRVDKLPRETGGILVGAFDKQRKILYVVDVIESPPDSQEQPTLYIRGSAGLSAELERIRRVTAGGLDYVGEWHSHPDGVSCRCSPDDRRVFQWLTDLMRPEGSPAVMLIACDGPQNLWSVDNLVA